MPGETQPQARRLRVFLSYSRHDKEFAQALRDRLIADGFDAFLDVHDIVKGEPWQERLQSLIGSADAMLFVITPASVTSEYCQWEVNEAERLGKRIVPVVAVETPLDLVRESAPEQALAYALAAFDKKALPAALGAVRRSIDRTILLRVREGATRFEALGGGRRAQWARSRDGTRIVIGQEPRSLLLLDGETLEETGRLDLPAGSPTAIAISAHARYVASADGSPRVALWTAGSGPRAAEIIAPHEVRSIVFGPVDDAQLRRRSSGPHPRRGAQSRWAYGGDDRRRPQI